MVEGTAAKLEAKASFSRAGPPEDSNCGPRRAQTAKKLSSCQTNRKEAYFMSGKQASN
jgi:hypothetical protein